MKTRIEITGQIGGNYKLLSAIGNGDEMNRTMFNGFAITFATRTEARECMRQAFKYLKNEDYRCTRLSHTSDYGVLNYDSSTAKIII